MRRHKAFCSYTQRIIYKVNHWHLFKDFYKRVFQGKHIGYSLRPWEGLLSEAYLWGKCLWQRSLLNLRLQIRSVARSCPTLCDPMNRSTPGLPVHHQLLEFTQTHVHRVGDAIQPSHPLSSPSPLVQGKNNAETIWLTLRQIYGYTDIATAAIMGNLQYESGLRSNNAENLYVGNNSSGTDRKSVV